MKRFSFRVRPFVLLAAAIPLLSLTACMTQNIIVVVNPDGSGQIAVTRVLPASVAAMIEMQVNQMREHMGDMAEEHIPVDPKNPLYNEDRLAQGARLFGEGVTLLSARPLERGGSRGVQALYEFEDINDVRIHPNIMVALMTMSMDENMDVETMLGAQRIETVQFAFSREEDTALLRLMLPSGMASAPERARSISERAAAAGERKSKRPEPAAPTPDVTATHAAMGMMPPGFTGQESPEEMMRMMFQGVRLTMAVEVRGNVLESSAGHPAPNRPTRFVLYDIDFDALMEQPEFEEVASSMESMAGQDSPDAFMDGLYAMPGVTVESGKDVFIKFE